MLLVLAFTGWALLAVSPPPAEAVVGGRPADPAHGFAAVFRVDDENVCSGALVAPQWVISAAHCFTQEASQGMTVQVGWPGSGTGPERAGIANVVSRDDVDIALVRLDRPVRARPVRLSTSEVTDGESVRLLGGGATCTSFEPTCASITPRQLDSTAVPAQRCSQRESGLMCVRSAPGSGPCNGDSGGPALHAVAGGWRLAGVSHGGPVACGKAGSTYTRTASWSGWVDRITGAPAPADTPRAEREQDSGMAGPASLPPAALPLATLVLVAATALALRRRRRAAVVAGAAGAAGQATDRGPARPVGGARRAGPAATSARPTAAGPAAAPDQERHHRGGEVADAHARGQGAPAVGGDPEVVG